MTTPRPADIRTWAREHGYEVAGSGRIPAAVRQAYEDAHPQDANTSSGAVEFAPPAAAPLPTAPIADPAPPSRGPYAGPVEHRPAPWSIPPPPPRQGTDGLAITALVLGFFGFLGLVFGIIALFRIRRSGRPGRGLAIAGVVLSSLWIVGVVVAVVVGDVDRDEDGAVQAAGSVTAADIRIGDCPEKLTEGQELFVDLVPCSEPHEAEALASFELEGTTFPGEDEVFRFAEGGCNKRIVALLPPTSPDYGIFYFAPSAQTWRQGDRKVICLVTAEVEGGRLTGPVPRG